jgi:hypothetical protein
MIQKQGGVRTAFSAQPNTRKFVKKPSASPAMSAWQRTSNFLRASGKQSIAEIELTRLEKLVRHYAPKVFTGKFEMHGPLVDDIAKTNPFRTVLFVLQGKTTVFFGLQRNDTINQ